MTQQTQTRFELSFWGGSTGIRHRINHPTFEAARDEAHRVLGLMANRAAHPAIIDGPGCGRDGITVA